MSLGDCALSVRLWFRPPHSFGILSSASYCCRACAWRRARRHEPNPPSRRDAREDSDYDVAVFIKDLGAFWGEVDRLVDVETDLLYDTGAVINSMPYRAGAYQDRTSLMREIRREGVDL